MSSPNSASAALRAGNAPQLFPRQIAVAILAIVACCFAGNHVAARLAFEHGTGLLVAVLFRSGVALSILIGIVFSSAIRSVCRVDWDVGNWCWD